MAPRADISTVSPRDARGPGGPAPKDTLRAAVRRERAAESATYRAARAARLAGLAAQVGRLAGPGVAGFLPTNSEPDVIPLLRRVGLPFYLPTPAEDFTLDWVRADPGSLAVVERGIPRPAGPVVGHGPSIEALVGAVLVPAVALDPGSGVRLGYGAGYYDRLLAGLAPTVHTIGVCREADLHEVPVEDHDRAVGWILTEVGLRRPACTATRKVESTDNT